MSVVEIFGDAMDLVEKVKQGTVLTEWGDSLELIGGILIKIGEFDDGGQPTLMAMDKPDCETLEQTLACVEDHCDCADEDKPTLAATTSLGPVAQFVIIKLIEHIIRKHTES